MNSSMQKKNSKLFYIDEEHKEERVKLLANYLLARDDYPIQVSVSNYKKKRTLSQNALLHVWFRCIYRYLKDNNLHLYDEDGEIIDYDEDYIKLIILNKFPTIKTMSVGNNDPITLNLSTSQMSVGEKHHFMDNVFKWCMQIGLMLPTPNDCEYNKLQDKQNA
jgi:hypothetical protein